MIGFIVFSSILKGPKIIQLRLLVCKTGFTCFYTWTYLVIALMAHCSGVSPSAMGKEGTRSPSNSFLSDRTRTIRFPLRTTAPTSRSYSSRRDLFSSSTLEPVASADVVSWSACTSILGFSSATSADFYFEIYFIQIAICIRSSVLTTAFLLTNFLEANRGL